MSAGGLVVSVIALLLAPAAHRGSAERTAARERQQSVRAGTWGGRHIGLEVAERGARVEHDCAHGSIDQPLFLDAENHFEATGTHSRERPGPAREGEQDERQPARYAGHVEDGTMTLSITLAETGEAIGSFTLVHGRAPILRKCL